MTSKFPLYIVLLELTEQLKCKRVAIDLRWQSRDLNVSADNLTNNKFEEFCPQLRSNPELDCLDWIVLPKLLKEAMELESLIQARKKAPREVGLRDSTRSWGKKRKSVGLRISDPW
jgi:hypothetical protein